MALEIRRSVEVRVGDVSTHLSPQEAMRAALQLCQEAGFAEDEHFKEWFAAAVALDAAAKAKTEAQDTDRVHIRFGGEPAA